MTPSLINAVIIDDHALYRQTIRNILQSTGNIIITIEAKNGNDFIAKQKNKPAPQVILLDINMPEMDGYETMSWIRTNYPNSKVIALSGYGDLGSVTQMYKMGACGYLQKSTADAEEILETVMIVIKQGTYFSAQFLKKMRLSDLPVNITLADLTSKQLTFLRLACTDMSYEEIADSMKLSRHTIDDYSKALYKKFEVDSRIGLILLAIKQKLISIN